MTTFLLPIASLIVCVFLFAQIKDHVQKHAIYYYIGSVLIVFTLYYMNMHYLREVLGNPLLHPIFMAFRRGTVPTAMFIIVMFVGAVPMKSWFYRTFKPIRTELSVMASILIMLHCFIYIKFIVRLFANPLSLKPVQFEATVLSLVMVIIMIPLFVTSFYKIRCKMKVSSWMNLQKLSYLFYPLITIHVLLFYYYGCQLIMAKPYLGGSMGLWNYILGMTFYTGVYAVYLYMKYIWKPKIEVTIEK